MDEPIIVYKNAKDVTELQETPTPPWIRIYNCFAHINGELFVQQIKFSIDMVNSPEFDKYCKEITTRAAKKYWLKLTAKS